MEKISDNGKIIALIIYAEDSIPGVTFFTPPEFTQQLGFLRHPAGHHIPPHTHNDVKREVIRTQEVLIIRKGKVKILLFTDDRKFFCDRILASGDVILLASGGHGVDILEDAEIIEVKQGPYINDMTDKERFDWPEKI